jgi:uracil-DNA glycosylase family protein
VTPAAAGGAKTFSELRRLVEGCRACDLWRGASQAVLGEGPVPARGMLVGEQPGDQEDRTGRPFVGPAGRVLDEALDAAGIDRTSLFVTNAVKHFKWKPRGTRRLHDKPNRSELAACHPWMEDELRLVKPHVLVLLGASAGQAVLGSQLRVGRDRGTDFTESGAAPHVVPTIHPSALLRMTDRSQRLDAHALFVRDLRIVAGLLSS